jgi:hypothetical protein
MRVSDEALRRIDLAHVAAVTYRRPKSKGGLRCAHLAAALWAVEAESGEIAWCRKRDRQPKLSPSALFKAAQISVTERIKGVLMQDFILARGHL